MEHQNALPAGMRLGEYEIESVLGSGGFGITYRAYDTHLNTVVAIKEYLPRDFAMRTTTRTVVPTSQADRADYAWGLERFLDEARTLARFKHPHINQVHRYFEAHGTAYMVLEYIEGETLSAVLQRQETLSEAQLERLLREVLSGLAEVHAADYVHRDLKPGNLMVRPDGSTVILDFGAARQAVGQRSKSLRSILTPGYAPIEQYDSKAEDVGPWSDIYALGIVAYRCISGLSDKELPDAVTRARNQRKGVGDVAPAETVGKRGYSRPLLRAIDQAIEVHEEDRPQSIAAWRQTLPASTLEGRSLPVPEPSTGGSQHPGPVPPPSSRSFHWATVVGVVALIVVVLTGGVYWLGQRTPGVPPQQATGPGSAADRKPNPQVSPSVPESSPSVVAAPQVYPFVVETEPVGAEVELLSIEESYRSGLELPEGRYQIEVRADGYEAQRVWVAHTASKEPHRIVLAAVRQPFTIVAEPADARIRILNISERYAAGMALPVGEYAVEVSADGYQTVTETVAHGTAPTERRIVLAAGRQPGETFRDCPVCPELVVVPAGSYQMGSPASEEGRDDDEGPVHRVTIAQPFAVGVYEVTFGEWDACVSGGGCNGYRPDAEGWGRGQRPVINVNWEDAQAYVQWLSNQTGQSYRLLSEAEWEYVARAGTTTPFHFGRTIHPSQANYDGDYTYGGGQRGQYRGRTIPVGSFRPNAFGLYDVHGNVWEWVQDCWNGSYAGAPSDGGVWERGDCSRRVLRGGSWINVPWNLRSASRDGIAAGFRHYHDGFRIARSLP